MSDPEQTTNQVSEPIRLERSPRTIQPSQELLTEVSTTKINSPTMVPPADNSTSQTSSTVLRPASIYPTAESAANKNPTYPVGEQATEAIVPKPNKILVIIVVLFGALISVTSLISILSGALFISYGYIAAGAFSFGVSTLYICLGVGLMLRRELARLIYIFVAVLGLLFSLYGTYSYWSATRSLSNVTAQLGPARKESIQKGIIRQQEAISEYKKNPPERLSPSEVDDRIKISEQMIESYERELEALNAKKGSVSTKYYTSLIPTYALSILPLVFLTRPGVKRVFSNR